VTFLDGSFVVIFYHFLDALFAGGSFATKQVNWLSSCQVKEGIARRAGWD
jgi:hypothetical protein